MDTEEHRENTGNLRPPWKPGETGNPNGRPKGPCIATRLKAILDSSQVGKQRLTDKQVADVLAEVIVKEALKGDYRFVSLLLDRVDGKVSDKLEIHDFSDLTDEELVRRASGIAGGGDPAGNKPA